MIKSFLENWLWKFIRGSIFIPKPKPHVMTPRERFGGVFDVVQLSRTLLDSKTFVDSIPKRSSQKITKSYWKRHAKTVSVAEFVRENFILPEPNLAPSAKASGEVGAGERDLDIRKYINSMWDVLSRNRSTIHPESSLLPLPHPYVVPGARFREMYYWDSYFTMLGLKESGRMDMVEDMVKNFAYLIQTYGFIPNGNRSYYLTRSHPPFFALMVKLLAEEKGEEIYKTYLPALVKEHKFWMHGAENKNFRSKKVDAAEHVVRMRDGEILNRYWDNTASPREEAFAEDTEMSRHAEDAASFYRHMRSAAESAWDFSSRWYLNGKGRENTSATEIVPVDLNAILVMVEEIIGKAFESIGNTERARHFHSLSNMRKEALRKYFWDAEQGWFCDYILRENERSPSLSLAGMLPLFAGVATEDQAKAAAKSLTEFFSRPGGLVTTRVKTGEQWDAPNGWAPLQYMSILGLERYGFKEQARDIAERWCATVMLHFKETGTLLEKYDVENPEGLAGGGEYPLQDGFGWTNGVQLALMNKYDM